MVEPAKNQLLRYFRRRSLFDFCNTICQKQTSCFLIQSSTPADTPFSRRQSSVGLGIIARRTAKITAVDRPNNNTPFIAVISPSNCQRRNGVTLP